MDFSPRARPSSSSRGGKPRSKASDLYSTVIVHGDDGETGGGSGGVSEDEDISKLPPLLQRLPKGFGAHPDDEDEDGDDEDRLGFSGTVIVKRDRPSASPSARGPLRSPFADARRASPRNPFDEAYATFLRQSTPHSSQASPREDWDSGTVVRKTNSGGGWVGGFGISPSMSQAVEIMRQEEESHHHQHHQQQIQQQRKKMSVSSVPDSITKEDPTAKYDLLHELGKSGSNFRVM